LGQRQATHRGPYLGVGLKSLDNGFVDRQRDRGLTGFDALRAGVRQVRSRLCKNQRRLRLSVTGDGKRQQKRRNNVNGFHSSTPR
jgi:hypothetical protein